MRARHTHPDALSVQAKLTALNLPFMRENYQPLAHDRRRQALVTPRLLHRAAQRRGRTARGSARAALHPPGPLPRAQDHRQVRLELAHQDQPAANPEPLPPGLRGQARQRGVHLRRRPGQEPSDDGTGLHRVPARTLGAVHRRHRHHQHAGHRARRRWPQAGTGGLRQARGPVHRLMCRTQ